MAIVSQKTDLDKFNVTKSKDGRYIENPTAGSLPCKKNVTDVQNTGKDLFITQV